MITASEESLTTPEVFDYAECTYGVGFTVRNSQVADSANVYDVRLTYTFTMIGA